jgi:hypothetical protein
MLRGIFGLKRVEVTRGWRKLHNEELHDLYTLPSATRMRMRWENKNMFMKNGVFWDVMPCGSCKNRRFGGTWRLLHQGNKNR